MTVEAFAPAKVNLTLHVAGQRDDGYHLLDSLVVFAGIGDRLTLEPGPDMALDVCGPFAEGVPTDDRNLIWRAVQAVGWTGSISLDKHLPHGAGIGGGSSDAAAVLKILQQQGVQIPDAVPLSLGADVPVCMVAQAARMQGIGEQVSPIRLPKLSALLVNPGVEVPTGDVFSSLKSRNNPAMPSQIPDFGGPEDCAIWLAEQRNDLEAPACGVAPVIERVLSDLQSSKKALLARMSGSGATCFAIYPDMKAAHFAAYEIGAEHPDWWCFATELS